MATFLAKRIVDGYLEFSRVPATLKNSVKTKLDEMGLGDLAAEEEE